MSPRAAWRLERLGFGPVYDYSAGKVDWMAGGLPTVRADTTELRAIDAMDPHPPTCGPDVPVAVAARLATDGGYASVIVLNDEGVVLGRLGSRGLTTQPDAPAENVMEAGPATVRAHEPLDPLLQRMRTRRVSEILVTTPEGRLLGLIRTEPT